MTTIRIARDLRLPLDVVTQAIAILARKGAGKTYTAKKLVEEVVRAKVPVVVLDPTGGWYGLRSSVDGKSPGLPVVIFGGDHGDVPLEPTAGKVIADVVLEHPGAYVLDLSGFDSRAAEQRFAGDFLERLYRGKKRETGPLLLVVDEADMFAPQRPGPEQTRTLGALEAIVRRGRIKGLGDLLISQRAAVLNKNVLTQTEVLVVMQTTGPQDRAAIDAWIEGNGTRDERDQVLGSLASLERGEAWVWSPSFLRVLQRVRILPGTTFDSSRTPEAGEVAIAPTSFAQVDLEQLGARIADTIEKAKADDPRELRLRIRDLERRESNALHRLAEAEARPAEPEVREVRVEVPVLNGQVEHLNAVAVTLRHVGEEISKVGADIVDALDRVAAAPRAAPVQTEHRVPARQPLVRPGREQPGAPQLGGGRSIAEAVTPAAASAILGKAERSILAALASYPEALTREQLAFLSGYHPRSKGFTNGLGTLRSQQLISPGFPATMTPAGQAVASETPAVDAAELVEIWRARFGRAERAVLDSLMAIYPAAADREELAAAAGFEHIRSKGFVNALGRLRGLGLVEGLALSDGFARLVGR